MGEEVEVGGVGKGGPTQLGGRSMDRDWGLGIGIIAC